MKRRLTLLVTGFLLVLPYWAWAQSALENPANGSTQSGISVISGWKCTAGALTARFDGGAQIQVVYGSPRGDTRSTCGDDNNGFVLLWNWNILSEGTHLVEILDDGVPFVSATVTVVTLGQEFLRGANALCTIPNFPDDDQTVTLRWSERAQNFLIQERTDADSTTLPNVVGSWFAEADFVNEDCIDISPADLEPKIQGIIDVVQHDDILLGSAPGQPGNIAGTIQSSGAFILTTAVGQDSQGDCILRGFNILRGNFLTENLEFLQTRQVSGDCPGRNTCEILARGSILRANNATALSPFFLPDLPMP